MSSMSERIKRAVVVATVPLVVICAAPAVASAEAVTPSAAPPLVTRGLDYTPEVKYHWWGGLTVRFNREQTELLAVGAGATIGWYWSWAVAVIGSQVLSTVAEQAVNEGNCLEITARSWVLPPALARHSGASARIWNCRAGTGTTAKGRIWQ